MIARRGDLVAEHETKIHVPVLVRATLQALAGGRSPEDVQGWIVDGTLGVGGHTRAILEAFPKVSVLGLDRDPEVLALARASLADHGTRVRTAHTRFSRMSEAVLREEVGPITVEIGRSRGVAS